MGLVITRFGGNCYLVVAHSTALSVGYWCSTILPVLVYVSTRMTLPDEIRSGAAVVLSCTSIT